MMRVKVSYAQNISVVLSYFQSCQVLFNSFTAEHKDLSFVVSGIPGLN